MKHVLAIGVALAVAASAAAQVTVPTFTLPDSNQLSDDAKAVLRRMAAARAPDLGGDLNRQRAFYGRFNDDRLAEMRRIFSTREERQSLGGVSVDVIRPAAGIGPRGTGRVLISVHGGAFQWGSGSGALVEAIPIAATMGVEVVAVDYRLAPEFRYPAASEDIAAVYRALLKRYRPENIGIYGCSAGGVITAQSVAWIRRIGLPRPGAIATLCGTGAPYSGDSAYLSGPTSTGSAAPIGSLPDALPNPYMARASRSDPAAYPLTVPTELAAFPPVLHLAGSRDFAASALTLSHRRLTEAGIRSELYLFDGLPHAFFVWPDMPESREAYARIADFFDRQLGRKRR